MSTRSRVKTGLAVAFALTALTVSGAQAQNVQNFRPAQGTWNYFSVEGARTAKHLEFVPRLYVSYASKPLIERDKNNKVLSELVASLTTANIMMDLGIADMFEIGLDVPIHIIEGNTPAPNSTDNSGTAIGDIRIVPKIRLFGLAPDGDQYGFGLALSVPISIPTGDVDKFVGDDTLVVGPSLVLEGRVPGFSIAANAGARIRPEKKQLESLELENELSYGLGIGVDLGTPDAVLIAEGFGVAPLSDVSSDSRSKPLEALLGFRFFTDVGAVFEIGGGAGIIDDYGAPEFRVIGGFAWHKRSNDRDGDGILDDVDQCPDDPEDADNFEDENGCPDPDNDKDGVLDGNDQCPMDPEDKDGFEDENGCPDPDNDQDKILDTADQCPNEAENYNEWKDEDGCPEEIPDTDGDGLTDNVDKCPADPEDKDGFEDEDGCPDPDNDKDGILDTADACPNQPEVINGVKDDDGCPDEGVSKVKVTAQKIEILEKVYFATNRARILKKSYPVLNQVASVLNNYKTIKKVQVGGHTDSTGKASYNKKLSQMRADSVMKFLVTRGIDASRLEAVGFGEDKPIDSNKTRKGKANNRRVEFTIVEQEGAAPAGE